MSEISLDSSHYFVRAATFGSLYIDHRRFLDYPLAVGKRVQDTSKQRDRAVSTSCLQLLERRFHILLQQMTHDIIKEVNRIIPRSPYRHSSEDTILRKESAHVVTEISEASRVEICSHHSKVLQRIVSVSILRIQTHYLH
jgi:hypothetical protein